MPWTVALQAPLFMEFSSPGNLPNPGIELVSPALAGGFFTTEAPGKPRFPAPLHLSPFSPPDRNRWVDSPALSARGPDLPCTTQDEAGLMGKFDT